MREERYYTATILPYLFAFNNFSGLLAFESALYEKGLLMHPAQIHPDIQLMTEVYLERDLPYYKIQIPSKSFDKKLSAQTKPDLLIINGKNLYLFECKFFTNDHEYKLHEQIMKQKYIFDIVENTSEVNFEVKIHFLVLPYEYSVSDCTVITWKKIYEIFQEIIPENDYFMQRLKNAIGRV